VGELDAQRGVVAHGRGDRLEPVRPDVDRRAQAQALGARLLAGRAVRRHQGQRFALDVDELAAARHEHALLERDARVGQVDLAARVAAHPQDLPEIVFFVAAAPGAPLKERGASRATSR
jgi:hypothetical protein